MRKTNNPVFTLYGRAFCHLCEDMFATLQRLRGEHDFSVRLVDIDDDPELLKRFDILIPVLEIDGQEVCHHFLDIEKVRVILGGFR